MVQIRTKKGLNIPIEGAPKGAIQSLQAGGLTLKPSEIALDLSSFDEALLSLRVAVGDAVKIGQPLAYDKRDPDRIFVSPAAGMVKEVRRGLKRRLLSVVITVDQDEKVIEHPPLNPQNATTDQLLERLSIGGAFPHIYVRPFHRLAPTKQLPRAVFIKALESAPFVPPAALQVKGFEKEFQAGLDTLARLAKEGVHCVIGAKETEPAFVHAKNVQIHTAEGPHPISSPSLHIQEIAPIQGINDCVWTLDVLDVIVIGSLVMRGTYPVERIVAVAGATIADRGGFFKARTGMPISTLIAGRIAQDNFRFISGNCLTGVKVESTDFLGFRDTLLTILIEHEGREFLHFFRLGDDKYSASGTYLSGHLKDRLYEMDTNQHGETRPFIIGSPYDRVMPLNISTMLLVKTVMAEDYELAEELGFLEVAPEDFALPSFVCPSKIEMIDIIKQGLKTHAADVLG
jgi:NADH:ubiquinone oxidoreductase, Na(+)-translocating, A subunit